MPFGVLRSYAEFLRVPTNKMQFQLFQVIKCVIDLLPWQCLRARRRTGRNDAYASLSFVFCKWRKMVLNYSDEEKKRMRDAIWNWKRRWRGVWTWVRCWCSQPWHHGARARAHTISPNSVNCTAPYAQWTDAVGSAINLHQIIMNDRGSRTHGEGFENWRMPKQTAHAVPRTIKIEINFIIFKIKIYYSIKRPHASLDWLWNCECVKLLLFNSRKIFRLWTR